MNLPEGWPTEAMLAEVEGLEYDFTPGGSETVTGCVSEEMAREIFEKMYAAAPTPLAQECKCDMRTKLVGDGCEVCNPELAAELASQEDEPVAYLVNKGGRETLSFYLLKDKHEHTPLYTRPDDDKLKEK